MEKILRILGREYGSISQAALLLGFFALLSQILGLFRDRAIAHVIGPSLELDAYYAAFRVPDLLFVSVASLFSVTVLVPFVLSKVKNGKMTAEAKKFLNDVFTIFFILISFFGAITFFCMPLLAHFIAPGFDAMTQDRIIDLSRIMLLSPILLGLSNLCGSITQLFRKFFLYALSPIFYNLGIILGVMFLYPKLGIIGLALGVVLGAFMHFLIQAVSADFSGFSLHFSKRVNLGEVKKVFYSSLPRTLGLSLNNIALLVIVSFASFLSVGSISIFNLSLNLQSVPLGIIGLSFAVAAFPVLATSYTNQDERGFKDQLKEAARAIVFWSLPITFLFIVLRAQIVRVILGSGSFSWENTRLVAASLAMFSISIVAQGLIALFARAYYASGNTRRPLFVNLFSSVLIVFFAYLLLDLFKNYEFFRFFIESLFKVSEIDGTEVLMLPLAYSLGTIINFLILWYFVKIDFMSKEVFIMKTFFQSLGASFLIGGVSYLALNALSPVFGTTTFWGVFWQGFLAGVAGILAGGVVLYMLKSEEFSKTTSALKDKFWKAEIPASSNEGL